MNRFLRFSVCRRSLLTGNQFTRRSSKPISSSPLISNNPTSSKFHHTFNYPSPQIFSTLGNQFRKFTGEPTAAECKFDDAYVGREISEVYDAIMDAQGNIELGYLPPLDAAKILADKFNALIEKLGLNKEKSGDYPEAIQSLKEAVDETMAFDKFAASNRNRELPYIWGEFKKWYHDAGGKFEGETSESKNGTAKFNSDENYLDEEISEVWHGLLAAQNNIELGILPPLDAVKITVDKFKAIMEIVGLDYEDEGDFPEHQNIMRGRIRNLQDHVQETVAFAEYVAAGKNSGPPCYDKFLDYDAVAACKFWEDSSELQNDENDTLPTSQDQIAMHVGDASSAVVAENKVDNTYQVSSSAILTTIFCFTSLHLFCFICHKLNQVICSAKYSSHNIIHTTGVAALFVAVVFLHVVTTVILLKGPL
ncbi:hypothetical protein MKX03_012724 [Papaver bracteatum]|nr:hypothetical protein MKX03_012724 [Papaver bracteatum]